MSIESNLSWHTANNKSVNEHLQFLDKVENRNEQSASQNLVNGTKQNEQTIGAIALNDRNNKLCCCIYFYRLKRLYSWKMPWIAILLSVVQVCFSSDYLNNTKSL